MASGMKVAGVMIAIAIGAMLFMPINTAVTENTGSVDVENESVTAELDTYVDLDGYEIESGSETVRWYNETSDSYEPLDSSTDYDLRTGAGAINVTSDSPVSNGDEVLVSYTYASTDGTESVILEMIPVLVAVLILGVAAFKAVEMM